MKLPIEQSFDTSVVDLEYSDDETSLSDDAFAADDSQFLVPSTRMLLIDEIDIVVQRKLHSSKHSLISKDVNKDKEKEHVPCPCCKSYVHCKEIKKSNLISSNQALEKQSSFSTLIDSLWPGDGANVNKDDSDNNTESQTSEPQPQPPPSFEYTVTRCIMETWVYKKGSGNDMFGSKAWKPRWCQLVVSTLPSSVLQHQLIYMMRALY